MFCSWRVRQAIKRPIYGAIGTLQWQQPDRSLFHRRLKDLMPKPIELLPGQLGIHSHVRELHFLIGLVDLRRPVNRAEPLSLAKTLSSLFCTDLRHSASGLLPAGLAILPAWKDQKL